MDQHALVWGKVLNFNGLSINRHQTFGMLENQTGSLFTYFYIQKKSKFLFQSQLEDLLVSNQQCFKIILSMFLGLQENVVQEIEFSEDVILS